MALDTNKLKEELIKIQQEMITKETPDFELYAQRLASAIETFVKSGEVIVNEGIQVQAGANTGITTAKGKGSIQ